MNSIQYKETNTLRQIHLTSCNKRCNKIIVKMQTSWLKSVNGISFNLLQRCVASQESQVIQTLKQTKLLRNWKNYEYQITYDLPFQYNLSQ